MIPAGFRPPPRPGGPKGRFPTRSPSCERCSPRRRPISPRRRSEPGPPSGQEQEISSCPHDRPFDLVLSLFAYRKEVRGGIRAAKYAGRSDAARTLARILFEAIRGKWADRFPAGFRPTIVPVPIRPGKYFQRGYNFPALVALPLGRLAGWPCDPLLLRRTGELRPQAGSPPAAREENVRGAFAARPGARVPPGILLVDDVYTSGATVAACARTLKNAGAEHIVVLTVARAILESPDAHPAPGNQ